MHDWRCTVRPYWCKDESDDEDSEDDEEDEEDEEDGEGEENDNADKGNDNSDPPRDGKRRDDKKDDLFAKPANEHPEHKYVRLWQSWTSLTDQIRHASYTDTDRFGM